jgi:hypothetical protein
MNKQHVIVWLAGVYALVFALLLIASIGDKQRQMNVQGWFSWHPIYILVLAADNTPIRPFIPDVSALVRIVLSFAATGQSLGFFVWAIVLWAQEPAHSSGSPLDVPANFFGLLSAALGAQMVAGFLICAVLLYGYGWRSVLNAVRV